MLLFSKPEPYAIRQFLNTQLTAPLSYPEVGATQGDLPVGYAINHRRMPLGRGPEAFSMACSALTSWEQLQLGWVSSWPLDAPLAKGECIAVIGRAFGLWWLNACRVVYTIDERESSLPRFGYAHGTLPDHLAIGEERFLVEMDDSETVHVDILAFSRPNSLLAKIGYPYMRSMQKRFGRESGTKLAKLVATQQADTIPGEAQQTPITDTCC